MEPRRALCAAFAAATIHCLSAQQPVPPPPVPAAPAVPTQLTDLLIGLDAEPQSTLELGHAPPAPHWSAWRRGTPIQLGAAAAPRCTVFVFHPVAAAAPGPWAAGAADCFAALQRRFADRGARVVLVLGDPELQPAAAWEPCSIVLDAAQQTANEWGMAPGREDDCAVVVDMGGRVVFVGDPAAGLVDAMTAACDGKVDFAAIRHATEMRRDLVRDFGETTLVAAGEQARLVLKNAPHDGFAWGVRYLAAVPGGAERTGPVRGQALAMLAGDPRPLARFADLALRGEPRAPGLAAVLAEALQPAAVAAPNDPYVQLALLRALVLADRSRDVGRVASRVARLVQADAGQSLTFAAILTQSNLPQVHRDLVQQALQRVEALGLAPGRVVPAKYQWLHRCAEDQAGAKALLEAHVEQVGGQMALNNDCWYLMTRLPTFGCYDDFAAALADRMLEQRDAMSYNEFDTAALAMFRVGRFAEAVELQETAVQRGGQGDPRYAERLARYRGALPAETTRPVPK